MKSVWSILCIGVLIIPIVSMGQEVNQEGWPIPNLKVSSLILFKLNRWMGWRRSLKNFIPLMEGMSPG